MSAIENDPGWYEQSGQIVCAVCGYDTLGDFYVSVPGDPTGSR